VAVPGGVRPAGRPVGAGDNRWPRSPPGSARVGRATVALSSRRHGARGRVAHLGSGCAPVNSPPRFASRREGSDGTGAHLGTRWRAAAESFRAAALRMRPSPVQPRRPL